MGKLVFSVDIEGTLADVYRAAVPFLKDEIPGYGNMSVDEAVRYMAPRIDPQHIAELVRKVWVSEMSIPLIDNGIPAYMEKIHEHYEIYVVTASPGSDERIQKWLDESGIVHDKYLHFESKAEKIALDASLYTDDDPEVAKKLDVLGKQVLFLPQPWNQFAIPKMGFSDNVIFVKNWGELSGAAIREADSAKPVRRHA
jgi:5'(3')-deoxyribonucleotidase